MDVTSENSPKTKIKNVAICGNPNCGKTTIFNAITGLRQHVANYPGVTVEKTTGQFEVKSDPSVTYNLIDVPGAYSLSAYSPDEYVAVQALLGSLDGETSPDVIINVIDATNLDRALYLLIQVLEVGKPVVVALNMMDLSIKRGLKIDIAQLSEELGGIPVIPVIGSKGKGIDELKESVIEAARTHHTSHVNFYHPATAEITADLMQSAQKNGHRTSAEYLRVLFDVNGPAEKGFIQEGGNRAREALKLGRSRLMQEFGSLSLAETRILTEQASKITSHVVSSPRVRSRAFSEKLDKYLLHPVLGPAILVAIMAFIFQAIFSWAEPLMNIIDSIFSGIALSAAGIIPAGPVQSLVVDGIIGGVGSVLVFLPQIIILFLFIAVLEDSGYMPRVAFLVDRAFSWCGLSGKSFIPLLSSFACAVPGIMATRVIEDRKLRLTTILVAPLMTCSARLPVYAIMIAAFIPHKILFGFLNTHGLVLGALYLLGLVVAVIVSLILKKTLLQTQRGTFMMEMPSYKLPTPRSVLIRVFNRAKSFVARAGTTILAITIIIWALSYYPRSQVIINFYDTQIGALDNSHTGDVKQIDDEVSRFAATHDDGSDVSLYAEARYNIAVTDAEVDAARDELVKIYPENRGLVEVLRLARTTDLRYEQKRADLANDKAGALLRDSYLGRFGRAVEPIFQPLGWDWKVTMATLSAFPAREVIIATLGTIYNLGSEVDEHSSSLVAKMRDAKWEDGPRMGEKVFSPAVALSVVVFFALCCQCGATLVTIKQETGAWKYSIGVFLYMTISAYFAAMIVFQLFSRLGF